MAFNAKKLRVALPNGEIVGGPDKPTILPVALDLDMVTDEAAACYAAANPYVTGVCFSHTCVDVFSDPVIAVVVLADALPVLREALEAQIEEINRVQGALARRQTDG